MKMVYANLPIIWSIRGYQRWLSPLKGFRCAHNVMHGQGSCSCYGLEAFQKHSLLEAWRLLQKRFKDCGKAAKVYQTLSEDEKRKRRERWKQEGADAVNNCDCGDVVNGCLIYEMISGCDVSACDASSCDVSGCDVSGCDFS